MSSIVIGNSVTSIDIYAFAGCSSLGSIDIPSSTTSIGSGAFNMCSSLSSVVIPDSVTSIADNAFIGCPCITEENNPKTSLKYFYSDPSVVTTPSKMITMPSNEVTFRNLLDLESGLNHEDDSAIIFNIQTNQ